MSISFVLLEEINSLLAEINSLNAKYSKLEAELKSTKTDAKNKEEALKSQMESDGKQRILLNKIETELNDLRLEEEKLRTTVQNNINAAINTYFDNDYKDFVANLYSKVSDKSPTFKAGSDTKKYLPEGVEVDDSNDSR